MATRVDFLKGFVEISKRWIVERTFGGFNRYRRLSNADDPSSATNAALMQVAVIALMVRGLAWRASS